jgi:hypothetical protein
MPHTDSGLDAELSLPRTPYSNTGELHTTAPLQQSFHTSDHLGYTADEINALARKWSVFFPGGGVSLDPRVATATVVVLENLALRAQAVPEESGAARYLVPMVYRCFSSLMAHRLFQVHVAQGPLVLCRDTPLMPKARNLRGRLVSPEVLQNLRTLHGIDAEAEFVAAGAAQLELEITRYQLDAVRCVAPEVVGSRSDTPAMLLRQIVPSMRSHREGAISPEASFFAVMSPEQVTRLRAAGDAYTRLNHSEDSFLGQVGVLRCEDVDVAIYQDAFAQTDRILAGWRNGPEDAGAFWVPNLLVYQPDSRSAQLATSDVFDVVDPVFFANILAPLS